MGKLSPQLADQLADWVRAHLVNRSDAYGGYWTVDGKTVSTTRKTTLTPRAIAQHFMADGPGDVIGLHAIGRDDAGACVSRWVAVDIDAHDDDDDPMANARHAHEVHDRARALGFSPLLLDSNGKGGFHVWVLFDRPIPSDRAYSLASWLVHDQAEHGLKVETFPKQATLKATKGQNSFGNWIRLVGGRHHKRDHWVRLWADDEWRAGEEAARIILATRGGSPDLIPAEALEFKVKPTATNVPKPFKGSVDLQGDEALAADALKHLGHMVDDYHDWMRVGFALHKLGQPGLALWDSWSQGSTKYEPGACESKWGTADDQGLTLGSIFHWATERGWKNPQARHRLNLVSPPAEPRPVAGLAEQDGSPVATRQRDKVAIEVNTDRARVLRETLAVVSRVTRDGSARLFTRGDVLVRVVHETEDETRLSSGVTLRNARGSARAVPVDPAWLSCWLTEHINFFEWKTDRNGEKHGKDAHPPSWLVDAIVGGGEYPLPPLRGLAEVPFPRPDGALVTEAGYDRATRVLLAPSIRVDVPAKPSQDDARQAAARLLAVVDQFPFETADDRGVWLAIVLTIGGRHAIEGACPGFALNSTVAGSGKGLLVDAASIIATGRVVPCSSYPRDDAEAAKVKAALALAATPVIHLDNMTEGGLYGGAAIDSALTSLEVNERLLGQTKMTGFIELRAVWILSGNNVSPGKDAHRRWMPCNLRTDKEQPSERSDLKIADLRSHLRKNRAGFVRDALTILKAHALAGRPSGGWAPLGSFEAWDLVVRGAVWFATGIDCNATRRKAAQESPERQDRLRLLRAWAELPSGTGRGHTVAYALAQAIGKDGGAIPYPALTAAVAAFGRDGKPPTPRSLGMRLRAMAGQRIEGMHFVHGGEERDGALWYVKVDTDSPNSQKRGGGLDLSCDSGNSGDSDSRYSVRDLHTLQHVIMDVKTYGDGLEIDSPDSSESQAAKTQECMEWLQSLLAHGRVRVDFIRDRAEAAGWSAAILDRAMEDGPIVVDTSEDGAACWTLLENFDPPCVRGETVNGAGESIL